MISYLRKYRSVSQVINTRPDLINFLDGKNDLGQIFNLSTSIDDERLHIYKKLYFGIGNTDYYRINLANNNKLHIKMEYANAMGNNHYSRYWIIYLFICETLSIIIPEETHIIEVTSGSSGIALSMACEALNYKVTILVPEILPENRVNPMRRTNTTIIRVQGYINNCIVELRKLLETGNYYATNHSEEKSNIITKTFSRIGYEITNQNIKPDFAILAMGNGTSTEGIAKPLKAVFPQVTVLSYHPDLDNRPDDIVFGLIGANIECRHIPLAMPYVDEIKLTSGINLDDIRYEFRYDTEINNLGYSSLYGIHFAQQLSKKVKNKTFLTIGYDKIDRY